MKKYSKCAIYSLDRIDTDESHFYVAKLVENTYNPKIPYGNKWEYTFYKAQIYTDLELEVANFDLGLDKNKMSFINISNPEHSIIRVLDFEYVNRTIWKGKTQIKDSRERPTYNQYIAINNLEYDSPNWKSEERKEKENEKKYLALKEKYNALTREYRKLKKQSNEAIDLCKSIKSSQREIDKNEKLFEKQVENIEFEEI